MGNPIQDAETALDEILNNVQTMRRELEEDFVTPLQRFPKADVDEIDMIHDQPHTCLLFAPYMSFSACITPYILCLQKHISNYVFGGKHTR